MKISLILIFHRADKVNNNKYPMKKRPLLFALYIQIILLLYYLELCSSQTTFYYEDENIRFYQMTLVPASGSINTNASEKTFTKPTDFIDNVIAVEMALCGFNLENNVNMEYSSSIKYTLGSFNITIQPYNQTSFQYISFYAILFRTQASTYFDCKSVCQQLSVLSQNPNKNRTQFIYITMSNNRTVGTNYIVRPFIKSMRARQGGNGYTRLQASYSAWDMYTPKVTILLSSYESIITEACITVTALLSNALGNNYTNFVLEQQIRQFTAASIKSLPTNFNINPNMYGPIFNKKCLIGFQYLYFRDGIKEIYFDATQTGFTSLTQNTPQYFYAEMSIFCVTRSKQCGQYQGIQTGVQQCVNCSVMIKNCAYCLTQSQCTRCATGYFIDLSKKCCPTYLTNCTICSLGNTCTQCADGFFSSETGTCAPCSSAVSNCARCQNGTFCYECAKGYTVGNYTSCKKVQQPAPSNNTGDNKNSTDNNNGNNTTSQSDVSSWQILFAICAGACGLLLAILIVLCLKMKRENSIIGASQKNHIDPQSQPPQSTARPTSLENHKLTDINLNTEVQQMVYESELKPGSGMGFRYGSKFNSYLTNMMAAKPRTFGKEDKTTRDLNSIQPSQIKPSQLKPSQRRDSLISQGMQKTSHIQPSYSKQSLAAPQSDRGFLDKNTKTSAFLPQISKTPTQRFGGSIHLKANYYK